MLLTVAVPVSAEKNEDAEAYVKQLVNYYRTHQDRAKTDINCLIYALN